eukprot:gene3961-4333_t
MRSSSSGLIYVVRHSEREDEVNKKEWENTVERIYRLHRPNQRNKIYFSQDPPITRERGRHYAEEVAVTLQGLISRRDDEGGAGGGGGGSGVPQVVLFASRMRRAVQTAYPLAQRLGLPIHLSTGLARVIPAVERAAGRFQFSTAQELASDCPGVTFIDCDTSTADYPLSTTSWKSAIDSINQLVPVDVIPIIVGHRETIRGLVGEKVATPYCCIGTFRRRRSSSSSVTNTTTTPGDNPTVPSSTGSVANELEFLEVVDRLGNTHHHT